MVRRGHVGTANLYAVFPMRGASDEHIDPEDTPHRTHSLAAHPVRCTLMQTWKTFNRDVHLRCLPDLTLATM